MNIGNNILFPSYIEKNANRASS
uniref:Uncharacterized protein n=1 Tax=Anopheles minimus TaxID=112268 RepID=A0A182WNU9_9DIPT